MRHATCVARHLGNVPSLTSANIAKCYKHHPLLLFHATDYPTTDNYLSSLPWLFAYEKHLQCEERIMLQAEHPDQLNETICCCFEPFYGRRFFEEATRQQAIS